VDSEPGCAVEVVDEVEEEDEREVEDFPDDDPEDVEGSGLTVAAARACTSCTAVAIDAAWALTWLLRRDTTVSVSSARFSSECSSVCMRVPKATKRERIQDMR
jgi:hypothetical protein